MSKKRKQTDQNDELNFWQPATDMFSALMLILMLIILLLGLYLVHIPEYRMKDPDAGNTFADNNNGENENKTTPEPTIFIWIPGGGGGSGFASNAIDLLYTPTVEISPTPTITPTPDLPGGGAAGGGGGFGGGEGIGEGPGKDPDMGMKSAVYVMLVDGDTNRSIKEANVQFELYGDNNSLQVLSVYYPERVSFRTYETMESGSFYFPEKLQLGTYELHELTAPEGYGMSPDIEFELAETYDWSDPLVIRVPLYPAQNIIRLRMTDADTGIPLPGGEFDVIAASNIITNDGTLRYRTGQVVSTIVCDEHGEGQSEEIYLGPYIIRQRVVPEYYAALDSDLETETEQTTNGMPLQYAVTSTRTKIKVSLNDELYPARGIGGAVFSVSRIGGTEPPEEVTTTGTGTILLDSLDKGATYQIRQVSSGENYRLDPNTYTVQVGMDGRIEGETEKNIELFNHIIRVSIGITDEFSDIQVADIKMTLYDASGTLVRSWTTTGAPMVFNDLEPGAYYIVKNGDASTRYDIQVSDIADLQTINLKTSYMIRYAIIGGIALFILVAVIVAVILIIPRRRKRRNT